MRTIHNVPAYAMNHLYIVVREAEGGLWFWGAFDDINIVNDICAEINGIVITPGVVKFQNMTLTEKLERMEQLTNMIEGEQIGDFDELDLFYAHKIEKAILRRCLRLELLGR